MPINQTELIKKLNLFLKTLGDETLPRASICNAFAFLTFRAAIIGKQNINLKRMSKLFQSNEKVIKLMAKSYQEYKKERRLLIEDSKDNDAISKLNNNLNAQYQQLTELRIIHSSAFRVRCYDEYQR